MLGFLTLSPRYLVQTAGSELGGFFNDSDRLAVSLRLKVQVGGVMEHNLYPSFPQDPST